MMIFCDSEILSTKLMYLKALVYLQYTIAILYSTMLMLDNNSIIKKYTEEVNKEYNFSYFFRIFPEYCIWKILAL